MIDMSVVKKLFAIALFLVFQLIAYSQCGITDTLINIPGNGTVNIQLLVDGIINNDLSDPNQGVCEVSLKFEHTHVNELTIELVSPIGQRMFLVGKYNPLLQQIWGGNKWDITFEPCSSTASPDLNFDEHFNTDNKWYLGSEFTGVYYPNSGCLEEFNTGPVNGTWSLIIRDYDEIYKGKFLGYSIEFCDGSTIDCNLCESNAGYFEETDYQFCVDNPDKTIIYNQRYRETIIDSLLYNYTYLLFKDNNLIEVADTIIDDFSSVGTYELCGLSYYHNDSSELFTWLGDIGGSDFRDSIKAKQSPYCASITDTCIIIEISNVNEVIDVDTTICFGDTIEFNGERLFETGNYYVSSLLSSGCDIAYNINLNAIDFYATIDVSSTIIQCATGYVILRGEGYIENSGMQFKWISDVQDNIQDSLEIKVGKPGIYQFVLYNNTCSDTANITITSDIDIPIVNYTLEDITCKNDSAKLIVTSSNSILDVVKWIDKAGTIYNGKEVYVKKGGKYNVSVKNTLGCSIVDSIIVNVDTIIPTSNITTTLITCNETDAILDFSSGQNIETIHWIEINDYNEDPVISNAGLYHVEYWSENGCKGIDSIEVQADNKIDFSIVSDTLNCAISTSKIEIISDTNNMSFEWITTEFDTLTTKDIIVNFPGIYNFKIHDFNNGCDTAGTHEVILENIPPQILFTKDTFLLTCTDDSIDIVNTINKYSSIVWNGPGGFYSNEQIPRVALNGTYTVRVNGENSCYSIDSVFVKDDIDLPKVEIRTDTINCIDTEANLSLNYFGNYSFEWKDPTGSRYYNSSIVTRFGGFHFLKVTDIDNGCIANYSAYVLKDTYQPIISIVASDSLDCSNDSIYLSLDNYTSLNEIEWTGDNLFSNNDSIVVDTGGNYRVSVVASSLCTDEASIFLTSTNLVLNPDTFMLTCIDTIVELRVNNTDSTFSFSWKGENLNSNDPFPKVNKEGQYKVVVSNGNCIDSTNIIVIDNSELPQINIEYDSVILCNPNYSVIKANLQLENIDSFYWSNRNGFYSNKLIDTVEVAGVYSFHVISKNGCISSKEFEIKKSEDYVKVIPYGDSINCNIGIHDLKIDASIEGDYTQVLWKGPNFNSIKVKNKVVDAGTYYITIISNKGCITKDSVEVVIDTIIPSLSHSQIDLITCYNDLLNVEISSDAVAPKFSIFGPQDFYSDAKDLTIKYGGKYYVSIEGENGCVNKDSFTVKINKLHPYIIIDAEDLDFCDTKKTINLSSSANLYETTWYKPNGDSILTKDLEVFEAGVYYAKVLDLSNGCAATDSVKINWDTTKVKIYNAHDYYLPCDGSDIEMVAYSSSPTDTILWFGPSLGAGQGNYNAEGAVAYTNIPGAYTIIAVGKNCSTDNAKFEVINKKINPQFDAIGGEINCYSDSISIKAVGVKDDKYFEWTGPNSFKSIKAAPFVTIPGEYQLRVIGQNACDSVATVVVGSDTIAPEINIEFVDSLICDKKWGRLNVNILNEQSVLYSYIWNSKNGVIKQGIYEKSPIIQGQGRYNLLITNTDNGCQSKDSIQVKSLSYDLEDVVFKIIPPSCYGYSDGEIIIDSVFGGAAPYSYSLDNYWFSNNTNYTSKRAGSYHFYIKDKFGCKLDTSIIVENGSLLQMKLGSNKNNIYVGDSVTIKAIILSTNSIVDYNWEPEELFSFQNDSIQQITLPRSSSISLSIKDANGCTTDDDIWIDVISKPDIEIPNIFTPNSDGVNDYFFIKSGAGVEKINRLMIFDNWGEKLFDKKDLRQNVSIDGWDGKFKGEVVPSGVYIYKLILELKDGSIEEIIGDVTVIR